MKIRPSALALLLISLAFSPGASAAVSDKPPIALEKAAEGVDADAQFELARAYLRGTGVVRDAGKAFALMKKAADQGHADALGGLGYFYASGVAVPKDPAAAVKWFRQGAEKGSARSQLNLGLALARGSGAPKDEAEGLRWIDAAAEKGLADALYAQGETYYWGQFGRTVDYQKALVPFQKAAKDGHAAAQNNLGVMLREGLGADKDEPAALDWFRKAAAQGNARAQSNLGHTLGVNAPDRTKRLEALKWVLLATDQKEVTAVKTMEELAPNLPPEELTEARKAADEFLK